MTFRPDYLPKDSSEKLKLLKELSNNINNMKNIDIESLVGSIDSDPLENQISIIMNQAENKTTTLQQKIVTDIEKEFCYNLELYGFMVNSKIEKDYFPFFKWLTYLDELEKKNDIVINMKYQNVFDMVLDISETDSSLSKGNLAYYLSKLPGKIKNYNTFFSELEKFVKENYTKASFIDMLCGDDTYGVHKGLVGKNVPLTDASKLIYSYAITIPNSSWAFKHQNHGGGLQISFSTSNYQEIYEEFAKTDMWKRINVSYDSRRKFVEEIFKADLKENPFYEEYPQYSGMLGIREIKWENLKAFVTHLSKDDVDLAEFMMNKILDKVPNDKRENYASQAIQVVNLALQQELQRDLPIGEIKEKKMKL